MYLRAALQREMLSSDVYTVVFYDFIYFFVYNAV